ncbi:TagG ABC-type polysaccharide/polyol phosphate export systems, permease component [Rhabdaerophilaceae bacterium]
MGQVFSLIRGSDLVRGLVSWPLWGTIGWLEICQRFRRSVIGPFWLTLSLGCVILGLGTVYAVLFQQDVKDYMPYLAIGLIVWTLISTVITEGCLAFIAADHNIKMLSIPLSVYVLRMLWRNIIIFAHNMVLYVIIILYFQINPGWAVFGSLLGLLLVCLNGLAFGLSLGVLSARFRDIPLIVSNGVQLAFFISPIMWKPVSLRAHRWLLDFNPFYYLIEVVRQPLLGQWPDGQIWLAAIAFTLLNLAGSIAIFARYRWRIAYWV